ncbi:MAG: hypothetical protein J7M38_07925 [Armatimonadetes bacterium]|nr:hypothetical protein [Armatimonadota bacterium]
MTADSRPEHGTVRIGLHFATAIRALELAAEGLSRQEVVEELTPHVPAADENRRRRIASTVARRYVADEPWAVALRMLVRAVGPDLDTRHLLLYALARREPLVLAVAGSIFYERFVLGRTPAGLSEREYAALNTGRLIETDEVVTHRLVDYFVRRQWGLDDPAGTQCVLRILREGGALGATWIARGSSRCLGYFPTHRGPSWRVFVYAMWDEFASRGRRDIPRAHLRSMALARLFALPGPVVDLLADRAAAGGFGMVEHERSGGRLLVTHRSFEEAARRLVEACERDEES